MAKLNPITGKISGKLAGTVYAVVRGEQIWREKAINVTNPKSSAQIAVRAKFKLLNQVAASVAPYIAIKREGIVSPRNKFVSRNYEFAYYGADKATIALADLQLTDSAIAMSGFTAGRENGKISLQLNQDMSANVDAVAYIVMSLSGSQELVPYDSVVVSGNTENGLFAGELNDPTGDIVIYSYGIRYNTVGAYTSFGQLNITTADALANLVVNSNLSNAIGAFTETRGMAMVSGESGETPTQGGTTGQTSVTLAIAKNPSNADALVSGAGTYQPGTQVTLSVSDLATGVTFNGWYDGSTLLSANATYAYTVNTNKTLTAKFTVQNIQDED